MDSQTTGFMIRCSRIRQDPALNSESRQPLVSGIDWNELFLKAAQERVAGLVFFHVSGSNLPVPPEVRERFQEFFIMNEAVNFYQYQKFVPVLQQMTGEGIDVAVTKGARLARTLYPHSGLRPFADIDLVVRPSAWPRLKAIFLEQGYESTDYETDFIDAVYKDDNKNLMWTKKIHFKKDESLIDIGFFPGFVLGSNFEEECWRQSSTFDIYGTEAAVFSLEHELAHLCIHAQRHHYDHLIQLTDIAEIAASDDLDADKLIELCRRSEVLPSVYYSLHLVERLWPGTLSEEFLEIFRINRLQRRLLHFLWPQKEILSRNLKFTTPGNFVNLVPLFSDRHVGRRLNSILKAIFPPGRFLSAKTESPVFSFRTIVSYLKRILGAVIVVGRRALRI